MKNRETPIGETRIGVQGRKYRALEKGREERDAKAAVGHRIEEPVAGGGQEEIGEQGLATEPREAVPKEGEGDEAGECRGEGQGMGQAAVAQRISVVDAEAEAEYIEVGQH